MKKGLYSFQSVNDPQNLKQYFFPPVTGEDHRVFHLNASGQGITLIEHMQGGYLTGGTAPMSPGWGEISVMFDFLPQWLSNNGNGVDYNQKYGGGSGALDAALDDYFKYVVAGGLGTLIDYYATSATAVAQRQCKAILNGDVTVIRYPGATHATLECTFIVPSGKWDSGLFFH